MKIALLGYGKMGKAIETEAVLRGHTIISKIDVSSTSADWENLKQADVVIEFTRPESALENIKKIIELNIPIVVGTTGWYENYNQVKNWVSDHNASLLHATNFSIGVQLFFRINSFIANVFNSFPEYNLSIEEIHHTQKLDAPSGTAITLAEKIIQNYPAKKSWELYNTENTNPDNLSILALRKDDVPGTHIVKYDSSIDSIHLSHIAHNRRGFAMGAVLAAEWIQNKKGIFGMENVINELIKINL